MWRALVVLLLMTLPGLGANVRLYLKDGGHHTVREYQKLEDRVRYYSTERGEWEEIPLELVDLARTELEGQKQAASIKEEAEILDAEDKAERARRREIEGIPVNSGVYLLADGKAKTVKQAETKIVNNRGRSILKVLTPIPIVSGKSTVELDGAAAAFRLTAPRPEFYIRLAAEERFGIARLTLSKKKNRIVQTLNIIPVSKEIMEEMTPVEVFRQQVAEGLYKIWPTAAMPPGEYAVVEYTEGKGNVQVWDFGVDNQKE